MVSYGSAATCKADNMTQDKLYAQLGTGRPCWETPSSAPKRETNVDRRERSRKLALETIDEYKPDNLFIAITISI